MHTHTRYSLFFIFLIIYNTICKCEPNGLYRNDKRTRARFRSKNIKLAGFFLHFKEIYSNVQYRKRVFSNSITLTSRPGKNWKCPRGFNPLTDFILAQLYPFDSYSSPIYFRKRFSLPSRQNTCASTSLGERFTTVFFFYISRLHHKRYIPTKCHVSKSSGSVCGLWVVFGFCLLYAWPVGFFPKKNINRKLCVKFE